MVDRIVTTGKWISVDPNTPEMKLNGLDSNHIKWGTPAPGDENAGRSEYEFTGALAHTKHDGSNSFQVTLGTFTHHNYVILMGEETQFQATLEIDIEFKDDGTKHKCTVVFSHVETINSPGYQDDKVKLPKVSGNEIVHIEGVKYEVSIIGFLMDGTVVPQFLSPEGKHNEADIVAKFERTNPLVGG
ncbi:choice-of-anchor K domain-containing protein [Saccharothrix luteola]|uniref:choice-of-anchor K domain-containing protein n=1 Tax=Saccharothrix luteola TaxID=2893018 RepID=UPI001E58CAB7|nr:choice-of-anchor K domain-containing protein [Saccharothrix luteola]MCC8251003.1 choice-of-anchor K domain-containing protein [Saccharothrix luteola]